MALILILEDDEVIRGQLARMLKDKGHNVEEAADVKEFDSKPHDNISLFFWMCIFLTVMALVYVKNCEKTEIWHRSYS